jgi:4'-phosphopantetheinyl transferase
MIFPQSSQLHLWFVKLDEDLYENSNAPLLNADEMKRASRFHFELHRKRYITARAGLRSILGQYLDLSPQNVQIMATPEGKPFLKDCDLEFNVSHSHDLALYAFSFRNPVGVDIEKMRHHYNDAIAERFFSSEEYAQLSTLSPEQKRVLFFKLWTGKEALVKALGEGLRFPFSSFSIPAQGHVKEIQLQNQGVPQLWYLENVDLFPDYQAAFVTQQKITQISYFEWTPQGKKNWRENERRDANSP